MFIFTKFLLPEVKFLLQNGGKNQNPEKSALKETREYEMAELACWASFYFLNAHPEDILLLILQRKKGREGGRDTSMWDRNIDQLLPVCFPTGHQTCNLGICPNRGWSPQSFGVRMTLQPTSHLARVCLVLFPSLGSSLKTPLFYLMGNSPFSHSKTSNNNNRKKPSSAMVLCFLI